MKLDEPRHFGPPSPIVFGPRQARSKTISEGRLKPEDYAWRPVMPDNCQVEAMGLCANALLAAGRVCDMKGDRTTGLLWLVSREGERYLAEHSLDAPPAYDGLAIAGQRAYLSCDDGTLMCFGE